MAKMDTFINDSLGHVRGGYGGTVDKGSIHHIIGTRNNQHHSNNLYHQTRNGMRIQQQKHHIFFTMLKCPHVIHPSWIESPWEDA